MKHTIQRVCLFFSLSLLGLSSNTFGSPQTDQGGTPGDSTGISEPAHPLPAPYPGTKYSMKLIKPSPKNYDCKIRYIAPDPSINYTIRNVRPELNNPFMWGNGPGN